MVIGLVKGLLAGAGSVLSKLIVSLASEAVLARIFFLIGQRYVESTKTDFDDKLFKEMKDAYYGKEHK